MPDAKLIAHNCTNRTIEFPLVGGRSLRLLPRQDTEIPEEVRDSPTLRRLERERLVRVTTSAERAAAEEAAKAEHERQANRARDEAKRRLDAAKKRTDEKEARERQLAGERKAEQTTLADAEGARTLAESAEEPPATPRERSASRAGSQTKSKPGSKRSTAKKPGSSSPGDAN